MLVNTITVIDAPMNFVWCCQDDISAADRVECVLHKKGNISGKIDIKLVIIMDMLFIVSDVIDLCKTFFIGDFNINIVKIFQKRF